MAIPTPVPVLRDALLLLLPHGGQQRARQNAWAGMSADAAVGRERRAAEAAMSAARLRAEPQAGPRSGVSG